MEYTFDKLKQIKQSLEKDKTLSASEIKKKYLNKDGVLSEAFKEIASVEKDNKAEFGTQINSLKKEILDILEEKKQEMVNYSTTERIDPTAPFDVNCSKDFLHVLDNKGTKHPIEQEIEKLTDIFKAMGFAVMESKQLDDDYHMFESLNFPKGHPARDMYDTFWTTDNYVLPAHTSTMQNRALKEFSIPIAVVLPGRCFRNEATDAGHEHTFHQIEGVYVDEGISLGNMEAVIKSFLETYLETKLEVRVQPSYFPFTEPDCEFIISCPFCHKEGCSICGHSGWIEIMGCGMIHPNVLREAGIDSTKYSGFAWGFGVDRLTMIKRGITDIRYIRNADLNFLTQF
ncbi:phenylalanine--tRNA ligase subunit alpha [bacterium]|nr:phenylalanine--tRNA ligase subunit alpha [bacterium]